MTTTPASDRDVTKLDNGHLKSFIERIENLEGEKREIAEDVKSVYAEAKSSGYDAKVMRKIVSERRKDAAKRDEEKAVFDLYWLSLTGG